MDKSKKLTRRIIEHIFSGYTGANFSVKFWDGEELEINPGSEKKFSLVLKHPGALKAVFSPPTELNITECYFFNDFDIEGDILSVFEVAENYTPDKLSKPEIFRILKDLWSITKQKNPRSHKAFEESGSTHSIERDKSAVQFHYDVSNDFYKLWLDENMVYSGSYFENRKQPLAESQQNKLDYICKKLRLQPGERMLDIGCGFGSLVIHAAQHYNVEALGVTLSKEQKAYADARIKKLGIEDRCRVEIQDYREIPELYKFDKISSVEMLHHIGEENFNVFFKKIYKLLKDTGAFFLLAITNREGIKYHSPKFSEKYFMPDYKLVPLHKTLKYAEENNWEVFDVENLREHYELTAKQWLKNLEQNKAEVIKTRDEIIYRIWRLSIALMAMGFEQNLISLYHFIFVKNNKSEYFNNITRNDWYRG